MKVLFVHNRYRYYGGEDVAVEMEADILTTHGHETKTIIFDNDEIEGLISKINTGLKAIYNKVSAEILQTNIDNFKPDVIHVHNLFFVASPSILYQANKNNIPVIFTLHNYRLICANALLLRDNHICELCIDKKFPLSGIKYKCYRNSTADSALVTAITSIHKLAGTWKNKANKYIVLTEFGKSRFLNSALDIKPDKFVVKPNFIYDPGVGETKRTSQYLFVGRISPEKGADILLEAFASRPEMSIQIIGEGPQQAYLEQEYRHCANIKFLGKKNKSEVLAMMKSCKALLFPSIWYEGLPFTIIEAFATGTPVITSRLGSMAEIVEHGYNGYHFNPGDKNDLIQQILKFEGNANNYKLYENARQTFIEKYHPDIHLKSVIELYKNAMTN